MSSERTKREFWRAGLRERGSRWSQSLPVQAAQAEHFAAVVSAASLNVI